MHAPSVVPVLVVTLGLIFGMSADAAPEGRAASVRAPSRTMQVWVKADDAKKYAVVCRAKFSDKVGDIVVTSDGGFTLTQHIDYTGKSYGKVGFMIDPDDDGWYGFTVFSPEAWTTSGCTVDELS